MSDHPTKIEATISREDLAAAMLSYLELGRGIVLRSEHVSFSMQCFVDEFGEVSYVDVKFECAEMGSRNVMAQRQLEAKLGGLIEKDVK